MRINRQNISMIQQPHSLQSPVAAVIKGLFRTTALLETWWYARALEQAAPNMLGFL